MIKIKVNITNPTAFLGIMGALSGLGRRRILRRMGMRFREIAQANFGPSGLDRPTPWPPYARDYPKYGKRKGQPATLVQTGKLRSSIYVDSFNNDHVVIGENTKYGARHQFGRQSTPARPFFPITFSQLQDKLTPYAEEELKRVAVDELNKILSGR